MPLNPSFVHKAATLYKRPLAVYQQDHFLVRQKAFVLYSLCLMGMGIILALLMQFLFILHQRDLALVVPLILCLLLFTGVLRLLQTGRLEWAVNSFLFSATTLTWSILFLEALYNKENPIFVTDTIVFLYSLLALAALISSSKKVFVPVFYLLNIGLLILFTIHISINYPVHKDFPLEYLMDNLFAIIIIYAVTSSIRALNDKALAVAENEARKNRELSETLEKRVHQRTAELEAQTEALRMAQQQIADNAHKAGQADIATSVLHNVGNILNSIVTSSAMMRDQLITSKVSNILRANAMLQEHMADIDHFMRNDPRGKKLLEYYLSLDDPLYEENKQLLADVERLIEKINLIREVILAQQAYVSSAAFSERLYLKNIIEDALTLEADALTKHGITLQRHYDDLPPVVIQKTKFIHALINIFKNARESMAETDPARRQITITLFENNGHAVLRIRDRGRGILPANIIRIFNYGFTTKQSGHGFGLHATANDIAEMGGRIWAESDGENKGATFVIRFPLQQEATDDTTHADD